MMTPDPQQENLQQQAGRPGFGSSEAAAALLGLCPKCRSKTLFGSLTGFAPRCRVCGLDFSAFNVGDGPAAFLTLIIGAVVVALAIWLELAVGPPLWVHIVLWLPLIAAGVIFGLRISKAWLLQAEYWRKAKEAGTSDIGPHGQ